MMAATIVTLVLLPDMNREVVHVRMSDVER
jgi:hypothetical protein